MKIIGTGLRNSTKSMQDKNQKLTRKYYKYIAENKEK